MNKPPLSWFSGWFSSSLRRTLVAGAAFAVLLPALVVGYFQVVRTFDSEVERQARAPAMRYAELLSRSLAVVMWNLDNESVSEQVDAVMRDPDVASVTVTNEIDEIVRHLERPFTSRSVLLTEATAPRN